MCGRNCEVLQPCKSPVTPLAVSVVQRCADVALIGANRSCDRAGRCPQAGFHSLLMAYQAALYIFSIASASTGIGFEKLTGSARASCTKTSNRLSSAPKSRIDLSMPISARSCITASIAPAPVAGPLGLRILATSMYFDYRSLMLNAMT